MKLQDFFSGLSLTVVLNASIVTIIPFASTSFLFHDSKAEAEVTVRNDYVRIDMPQTGNQDDNWSCGPTSAARLINFYRHNVNRDTLVNAINREFMLPPKINKPWGGHWDIRTGTTPHVLRDVMKRWEGENVKLERKADFNKLLGLLRQGKPVLVLLRVGSIDVAGTTWPAMHWVVVNGFSASDQQVYFTETEDGETYQYSYDDFQSKWDWRVGRGLASESLNKNGVEPKTMIWVDRVSPVVAQSSSTPTGIPISVNFGNTLFYDRNNGVCAFRESNGSVIQRLTSCRRSWHSIVYTANMLLFYDQDAGQIETYRVGSQGLAERLHTYAPNSMRKTWAQITSPSEGIIVFRDNNGQVETYRLNNIGMLQGLERSVASSSLRSLQSFNFSGHFIRHANFFGYISVIDSNLSKNDATWSMVSGLANSQCSSFESKNFPGHYLRHQGFRIKIHQNDNTDLFKADATFCLRNGLADRSSFSFESLNFPNHYIRHRSSELWVDPQANDDLYKNDATFRIVNPFVQ